jgi:hypothetical protein
MTMSAVAFCLLLGAIEMRAGAQALPTATPESAGLSSARVMRIGDALSREIDAGRMPGAVVAITRRGTLVYHEAFGFLDMTAGTPMRKDAIFSIASMTKPIFAVAAMSLHEEGRAAVQRRRLLRDPSADDRRGPGLLRDGQATGGEVTAVRPIASAWRVAVLGSAHRVATGHARGFRGSGSGGRATSDTSTNLARQAVTRGSDELVPERVRGSRLDAGAGAANRLVERKRETATASRNCLTGSPAASAARDIRAGERRCHRRRDPVSAR